MNKRIAPRTIPFMDVVTQRRPAEEFVTLPMQTYLDQAMQARVIDDGHRALKRGASFFVAPSGWI